MSIVKSIIELKFNKGSTLYSAVGVKLCTGQEPVYTSLHIVPSCFFVFSCSWNSRQEDNACYMTK